MGFPFEEEKKRLKKLKIRVLCSAYEGEGHSCNDVSCHVKPLTLPGKKERTS